MTPAICEELVQLQQEFTQQQSKKQTLKIYQSHKSVQVIVNLILTCLEQIDEQDLKQAAPLKLKAPERLFSPHS